MSNSYIIKVARPQPMCVCVCVSRVAPPNKHLNKVVVSVLKRNRKNCAIRFDGAPRCSERLSFVFCFFKCHIIRCVTVTYICGSVNFPHCATWRICRQAPPLSDDVPLWNNAEQLYYSGMNKQRCFCCMLGKKKGGMCWSGPKASSFSSSSPPFPA